MGLAFDRAVYSLSNSSTLTARLSIRNSTADPLVLSFANSQMYDLETRDAQNKVVYQWSKGKIFSQIVTTVAIQYETDYIIAVPLANLPPGNYVAQGWLVVAGPTYAYSASTRF